MDFPEVDPLERDLTVTTVAILWRAGWTPGRRAPASDLRAGKATTGHPLHNEPERFLERFGGLEVREAPRPRDVERQRYPHTPFNFCAADAADYLAPETREAFESAAGEGLSVIGDARGGRASLMMGVSGAMYGGFHPYFWRIGESPADSLNALCEVRPSTPIPLPALLDVDWADDVGEALEERLRDVGALIGRGSAHLYRTPDGVSNTMGGGTLRLTPRGKDLLHCAVHKPQERPPARVLPNVGPATEVARLDEAGVAVLMTADGAVYGRLEGAPPAAGDPVWRLGPSFLTFLSRAAAAEPLLVEENRVH